MAVEWEAVAAVGEWVGALATLGGFYFVVRQLGLERKALETQAGSQVYQIGFEILKVFVESPELRRYFYEHNVALPPENSDARSRALAAAEMIADHFENIHLTRLSLDGDTREVWLRFMRDLYQRSPAFRHFLLIEGCRYTSGFLADLDADLPRKCGEYRDMAYAAVVN